VVKVIACGPRTGSFGQRNHSDRHTNDGNQISDERCSPGLPRLFQNCCGTQLSAKAQSTSTTLAGTITDSCRADCNAGMLQRAEHKDGCIA
jgi:hypothetical protein